MCGFGRLIVAYCSVIAIPFAAAIEPVPEKLVVLTFDDSVKSHFTVVRPILLRYGFGATFFITEGFDFRENKHDYMTWEQISQLNKDGFEIGNHTRDHLGVSDETVGRLAEQLAGIDEQCLRYGIPRPVSFAYPGNRFTLAALPLLKQHGIRFARRGGWPELPYREGRGFAYEPGLDHPLLIPSSGDARPTWTLDDFREAVQQAQAGRIAVLQFHGVPDRAHPWVHTSPDRFEAFMKYLAVEGYRVVAIRDLAKFVDPGIVPRNPQEVHNDRKRALALKLSRDNFRTPADDSSLKFWLENMVTYHGYSIAEVGAATGLTAHEIQGALRKFQLLDKKPPAYTAGQPLVVRPYPGGRHPRSGFLDGAMRPQRETKISVFTPWANGGYVVVDVPEAIWTNNGGQRELLYLAHTHVPTMWSKSGVQLPRLEWRVDERGGLSVERRLPNRVVFAARISAGPEAVRMELTLSNGTDSTLTGLRVQNCVMLKAARGFQQTASNQDKHFQPPYAACRNESGDRWIITAWVPHLRAWGNPPCPCMHSDPQFPACEPGETQAVQGWLSFYEGTDIEAELRRIDALDWAQN